MSEEDGSEAEVVGTEDAPPSSSETIFLAQRANNRSKTFAKLTLARELTSCDMTPTVLARTGRRERSKSAMVGTSRSKSSRLTSCARVLEDLAEGKIKEGVGEMRED